MNDDKSNQRAAPVGGVEAKTPGDRVRQIQELQRLAEAAPVTHSAPPMSAGPVGAASAPHVGDGFAVVSAQAIKAIIAEKVDPKQHASYAKVQKDVASLFGGNNGVEIKGEPWKIISFLDAAPALFEPKQPLANYEPLIAAKSIVTPKGLLFEVGLKAKDGTEPVQKRQVLVGEDGQLRGAQCKTPDDLNRLLKAPGFFERLLGSTPPAGWKAQESKSARFEVRVPGPKNETVYFNNFGLRVPPSSNRSAHDFVANYHLDQFGAAV